MITKGKLEGQRRNQELNGGAPRGWNRQQPTVVKVKDARTSTDPVLYAIISTWHDADIIRANIETCFANGCSKVFVLDNDSPDKTEDIADAAGATEIYSYTTKLYDEDLRIKLQNEIVKEVTEAEKLPSLWWMILDADEFGSTRTGDTIQHFLSKIPGSIKTVGCDFIDLYPTGDNIYESGHPATQMTHGVWRRGGIRRYCQCGHWKHSIVNFKNGNWDVAHFRGNHGLAVSPMNRHKKIVTEPDRDLVFFHAPIRSKEATYKRLDALCAKGRSKWDDQVTRDQGSIKRWKSLDDIYAGHWAEVQQPHTQVYGRDVTGLALYPWRVLLPEFNSTL